MTIRNRIERLVDERAEEHAEFLRLEFDAKLNGAIGGLGNAVIEELNELRRPWLVRLARRLTRRGA